LHRYLENRAPNGVNFPRLQRIDYRFKWGEDDASRRNSYLKDSSGQMQASSVVYNPWHKNRVTLYIACIRVDAAVDPDLTRIHPNAVPVTKKQSHCTSVLIGWRVAKSAAVAAMPIVVPVVRATTGSKHPRKSDSSMIGPSNPSRRTKFQKWIT
jgi:hypothetical protein